MDRITLVSAPKEHADIIGEILAGAEARKVPTRFEDALRSCQVALRADTVAQPRRELGRIDDTSAAVYMLAARSMTALASDAGFLHGRPVIAILCSSAVIDAGGMTVQAFRLYRAGETDRAARLIARRRAPAGRGKPGDRKLEQESVRLPQERPRGRTGADEKCRRPLARD